MDINVDTQNESIRKIEDIIDIQKAKGNFSLRQVAFNLPSETDSTLSANLAKSLESGLSKSKSENDAKKKFKKLRPSRQKSPLNQPDVVSWPSDSDITVLRMKLCLTGGDLKERVGNVIPGDGLHQRDSSSMVNLATLIRQSQPPSKANFNMEEYLVPLTSWDRETYTASQNKEHKVETGETQTIGLVSTFSQEYNNVYQAMCSHDHVNFSSQDSSSEYSQIGTVSRFARFLRLYFCPCCTCLYKLEKMREEPSAYFTKESIKEM